MRLSIDARADSLRARNRVEEARRRAEQAKQAKAVEIIGDSGDRNGIELKHEIIEYFRDWNARTANAVPTARNSMKSQDLSGNWNAPCRASGDSPPFKGEE